MGNKNFFWIGLIVVVLFIVSQQSDDILIEEPNLASLVDSSVSFTGRNLFVGSQDLRSESVRVISLNGGEETRDLGFVSLDSGTVSTIPEDKYKFYFFMNDTAPSSNYYVDVQEYTAPIQDAVDPARGFGCEIESAPIFTSFNAGFQAQSSSTNALSIAANTVASSQIRIAVRADRCYGMPDSSKGNVVCFRYNTTVFDKIEATGAKSVSAPATIANTTGIDGTDCYEFNLLQDGGELFVPISIDAGTTEPTTAHNITVYSEDAAFDLNEDTLAEIWGYTDEDGNTIAGLPEVLGTIFIS